MATLTCANCGKELTTGFVVCRHCGERADKEVEMLSSDVQQSPLDDVLVKIHHWSGVNLLGVLLLCVGAFGLWGGIEMGARLQSREVGVGLLTVAVLATAILDLAWRLIRGDDGYANRLFSPLEGGCILYLPIWIYVLGAVGFVGILVASRG